jgi:hypothetical protein
LSVKGFLPRLQTAGEEGEEYIVKKNLVAELATEITVKQLCLAITRQGTLFFLPLRLPGPDGRDMEWWRSLCEHADRAMTTWVKVVAKKATAPPAVSTGRSSRVS